MASDLVFTVKAKTDSAAASFKKLASSIAPIKKESDAATASMTKLGKTKVKPKVDDSGITKINDEIHRLQAEMRHRLEADVTADTSDIRRKLTGLRSTLRELERTKPVPIKANVGPITRGLDTVKTKLAGLKTALANTRVGGFAQRVGSDLATMGGVISGVSSKLGGLASGLGGIFKSVGVPVLGAALAGVTALGAGLGVVGFHALEMADSMERSKLQLDSFTHSSETTVKLLKQVQAYADKTPFEFPELASASKRLLGVGISAGKIPKQLAKIGDIAAQSGASVDDLALIFAQMTSAGRVSAEDMNQLADRGINAWPTLAKAMGKSVAEVRKLGETGKLGTKEVQLLWDTLSKGAKGSTDALANTLSGQISTLKDTVNGVLRDIGNALLPFAKVIVPQMTKGVEGIGDKVLDVMPKVIDGIAAGLSALLDLPGQILRGLGFVASGFSTMVANVEHSIAGLMASLGASLMKIPGMNEFGAQLFVAASDLDKAADRTQAAGKDAFSSLIASAQKADTAVAPLKGKIEAARKVAQQGIVMAVSVKDSQAKIETLSSTYNKAKAAVEKHPTEARIKARDDAKKALDKAKANLEWLNKYEANPKLLAKDLASGKVKIVKGVLQSVPKAHNTNITATDKTKAPTNSAKGNVKSVPNHHDTALKAKDGVSGPAKNAKRTVEDIPRSHNTVLTITTVRKSKGGSSSKQAHTADPQSGATSVQVAAPQVSLYVRDEKLADLIDIRVDQRVARASRIIRRRGVVHI